jgi:hypothetical protein
MPHPQRATTGLAVGPRCGASKAMYGHGWLWPFASESDVRSNVSYGGAKQTRFAHHEFCPS